jgi:hypothetical protein
MDSTMQDSELAVSDLFEHGAQVHPDARVIHCPRPPHQPQQRTTTQEVGDEDTSCDPP